MPKRPSKTDRLKAEAFHEVVGFEPSRVKQTRRTRGPEAARRQLVAIVGMGPGAENAPGNDPDWSLWAMAWDRRWRYQADRLFEMHDRAEIADWGGFDAVAEIGTPCYWQHPAEGMFVEYPLSDVIADIGRDWFESSVAYMIALAIHEGAAEIGLWGIHGDDADRYLFQRPNITWLLGIAEARGIAVTVPPDGRLLRYSGEDGYPVRYGYR